jgi:hypothetical protein
MDRRTAMPSGDATRARMKSLTPPVGHRWAGGARHHYGGLDICYLWRAETKARAQGSSLEPLRCDGLAQLCEAAAKTAADGAARLIAGSSMKRHET